MTPEIRAAVKTLAAAFQAILEALAKEETPPPRPSPPAPAPGHASHLVVNRRDGLLDFCCPDHERRFEEDCARYRPPERTIDVLAGPVQRFIQERLGDRGRR